MGCIISKIRKFLRKCFGPKITPKVDSLMEDYRKFSTPAKNVLSSFIEQLRENQSTSADLLEEAVNRFRNDEPNTSVLMSLQKFKAKCNTYLHENNLNSSCEREDSCNTYTDKFSGVKNILDEDLKMVERWNTVAQWVFFVISLGLQITSSVLSYVGNHPLVAAVIGPVVCKGIDSLESKINNLCFEKRKNSLKNKIDNVDLLMIAIDKHRRIKDRMLQASRDIEKINGFKARVHKLVDVYISNFADHGNDEEAAKLAAMDRIETENRCLQISLQDLLRNVERCLEDLSTATENIQRLKN
ncbi:uncharacterized protein LOC120265631 [Dioscorea cayenensis subsp. rotundata]|uniref:Uncharacterized protein LOC120265631 n=1 Tax=Dioscorea cayennensis subsp. rotundata TaxID=55577 RepID=A0AB40BRJ4_DIOCR|nr:uncharacterized protein LOC120265631 [Dioscorea cayenensis subsp. rotundata]XP_039129515.1 uncharacterized protein LOC120265631 [Dioscorea cayenensis subsp. rotundata]XP_039129516.1 uncharacterized protein LOC120265631 [Dioscorea cayenensis subsp. rotundata]